VLTIVGELLLFGWDIFPIAASEQATTVDEAFFLLTLLAVPIFTFVITVLGYTLWKFRGKEGELVDGPPARTHSKWVPFWLFWTTALTIAVIIHPGYTGLLELRETESHDADVVIDVVAQQWIWLFDYQDEDVSTVNELVIPIDKVIRFNITALDTDVVHSFWVPAFRTKIDAVPGLTTHIDVTPNRLGGFNDDVNYRVQCAELCGLNHGTMFARVEVVEEAEYRDWIAERSGRAAETSAGSSSS
jgi:cytochrome c oxidase subunit 2